ncbi:hypothetical protein [Nostoc sp.]|uniref:hypothetical protein n=1 Tax=Nostoc sp. TaxID=1180 RepID=UPI002FF75237
MLILSWVHQRCWRSHCPNCEVRLCSQGFVPLVKMRWRKAIAPAKIVENEDSVNV